MLYVGNDVVDLNDEEVLNKHCDARFIRRVFDPNEQRMISRSGNSCRTLWMIWASKETAYKILSKIAWRGPFSPRLLQVGSIICLKKGFFRTKVKCQERQVDVHIDCQQDRIHAAGRAGVRGTSVENNECFAMAAERQIPSGGIEDLKKSFTDDELKSIQSQESAWVRHFAKKDLTKQLKIPYAELSIIRRREDFKWGPPQVYRNNAVLAIDISLSHHGKWIAWAWSGPTIKKRHEAGC
ncbi:MAG: 4'-phosphopantetheinyl transferase superfamily protein [Desulfobacterales bacterium]|nr:4'-phosphopantetheinyl transferase superfamily protein [Desulfobacterales bacterium]